MSIVSLVFMFFSVLFFSRAATAVYRGYEYGEVSTDFLLSFIFFVLFILSLIRKDWWKRFFSFMKKAGKGVKQKLGSLFRKAAPHVAEATKKSRSAVGGFISATMNQFMAWLSEKALPYMMNQVLPFLWKWTLTGLRFVLKHALALLGTVAKASGAVLFGKKGVHTAMISWVVLLFLCGVGCFYVDMREEAVCFVGASFLVVFGGIFWGTKKPSEKIAVKLFKL